MIDTAEEMEAALRKMDDDQREHLRVLISEVVQCYINEDLHGLVLVGGGQLKPLKIMSVNANEMEAAALLTVANEYINYAAMQDAPPKEQFN